MTTVAQQTIELLRQAGIDTLFCLPGVQNDNFFNALVDAHDIRPIVARHEQGAAYMALGASQATGAPTASIVVPGPGLLNAGAALTSAYWAGGRIIALTGAVPDNFRGRATGVLHDLPDQTAVLAQVTKSTHYIGTGDGATETMQTVLDEVFSGAARPVGLELAASSWLDEVEGSLEAPTVTIFAPEPAQVADLARRIGAAKRPAIVVGGGAQDASAQVRALVDAMGCPVFTRRQGHGVVDCRHPLWCPLPVGREFWRDADLIIAIGTRLEFPSFWGTDDDLTIVSINIDEHDLDLFEMGTIGIHADAALALDALLAVLPDHMPAPLDFAADVAAKRAVFDAETAHLLPQREHMAAIRAALPDDGVIVEDVTQMGFAAHILFEHRHPRSFLTTSAAGTLGACVPHAIGAQAALPDRTVLGIAGDGGFMFSATELATAVQHNIAVTILLYDDGAFGNVKRIQSETFGPDRTIVSTLQNPDFVKFGESFGVHTQGVSDAAGVQDALIAAFAHDGPSLVVCSIDAVPNPWPWLRMGPVRGPQA